MRRKDREVTEFEDIVSIVDKCQALCLAMVDEGHPYVVPLNFAYESSGGRLTLYMHSALEGRKIDILKKNPEVCFTMTCSLRIVPHENAAQWTAAYESVTGSGQIEFLDDMEQKRAALDLLVKGYGFQGVPAYTDSQIQHTCILKLEVRELSGKRNIK